jgi:curved DNA-binding protein CbpA
MSEQESCRILGIAPGASLAELKSAYRRLAKAHHPDSQGGSGSARAFLMVTQAYRNLMDARLRGDPVLGAPAAHRGTAARRKQADAARPGETFDLFSLGRAVLLARDPRERAAAARALAASGKKSAYAFLRKALWDKDERVLSAVVRAIADLDIRQSAGELGSLFSKATPALKKEILAAVARMRPLQGFASILRIGLGDPDAGVRRQATKALGRPPAGRR